MNRIWARSFGGLSRDFYLRQLLFAVAVAAVLYWMKTLGRPATPALYVWLVISTLLYPYVRYLWHSIVDVVLGENVFYLPAVVVLFFKVVMMFFCFTMAIPIAPVGLLLLYWQHSRRARLG